VAGVVAVYLVLAVVGVAELAGYAFRCVVAVEVLGAGFLGAEVAEGKFQHGGSGFGPVAVACSSRLIQDPVPTDRRRAKSLAHMSCIPMGRSPR
jgi:hypothetical protein